MIIQKQPGLAVKQAKERLKGVQGHIVLQPLDFLKNTLKVAGIFRLPISSKIPKGGDAADERKLDLIRFC